MAAQQAAELAEGEQIHVIVLPTHSIQQGVSALYAYQPHALPEENEKAMAEALRAVHSMAVTYAVRDSEYDGKAIRQGQILGLTENQVTVTADSREDCVRALLEQVPDAQLRHGILWQRRAPGGGPGHGAADGPAAGDRDRFGHGQRAASRFTPI